LSYLPQEPSIFRRLTVKENILAALEQRPDLNKDDRSRKLKELLNDFSLHEFSETKGIKLSGGERRRVEIARALASNPKFLLLDEPFAGIDPIAVSDLKSTIKSLNDSGYGILISDHNVRDTMQICHKVLIMSEGKIVAEGSPDEISNNEKVKEVYLGKDFSS
jgi:lipopolysaccharide export system ATP-binding protein